MFLPDRDTHEAMTEVMAKQSVTTVAMADAPKAAGEVIAAVKNSPDIAIVPVKSTWLSKINWVQAAGLASTALAFFGLSLPPEQIVGVIAAIQTVVAVATWIIKTFFTGSVTPSSVGKVV